MVALTAFSLRCNFVTYFSLESKRMMKPSKVVRIDAQVWAELQRRARPGTPQLSAASRLRLT